MSDEMTGVTKASGCDKPKTTLDEYFKNGVFIIVMLLAFVATFQFYFSMQGVIETWFEYQYVQIFRALYNLAILVVCVYLMRLYILTRK